MNFLLFINLACIVTYYIFVSLVN